MFRNPPEILQDPRIDHPIHDLDLSFAEYIKKYQDIISKTRPTSDLLALEANAPFELRPHNSTQPEYGALLIHGLFDSPFMVKDIGQQLQAQGMLVRAILLPGHGIVPGALLNIDYHDWLQAVRYGVATLAKEVSKIYLVGFSTGGSLALFHAAQDPSIAGVIMLSPALKICSWFDFMTDWHHIISWALPRAAWLHIKPETDYAKYQSVPLNAVYQLYRLIGEIKKININAWEHCPLFMAVVFDDKIICSRASIQFFLRTTHQQNRMIIYSNKKLSQQDPRIIERPCTYPEMNIVNFSHLSLPISPDNPHYGKNGDYPEASHIDINKYLYDAQTPLDEKFYDFLYRLKLTKLIHRRLTFNPDLDFLMDGIDRFIFSAKTTHQKIT